MTDSWVAGAMVVALVVGTFTLVPVVSFTTSWPCGNACEYEAPHPTSLLAYQSLSCVVFGVGAGFSNAGAYGTNGSTYQLSCPPKVLHPVGRSFG